MVSNVNKMVGSGMKKLFHFEIKRHSYTAIFLSVSILKNLVFSDNKFEAM